jgi:hypothetical protein
MYVQRDDPEKLQPREQHRVERHPLSAVTVARRHYSIGDRAYTGEPEYNGRVVQ